MMPRRWQYAEAHAPGRHRQDKAPPSPTRQGTIRYTRIGEGGYAEMETMIRRLLNE
ncbi:MAG: hypothetical protein O6929_00850 [candidate division NC10 bacterium]|nr:hypothetical protein [candidate division NC10 bacterium]